MKEHLESPQIYLSDNIDSAGILGFKLHLEVVSIRESNYNKFHKLVRQHPEFKYAIVGGSASNFNCTYPINITIIPFVEEVLTWFFGGTNWVLHFNETYLGYCRFITQQLQKSRGDNYKSFFRHTSFGADHWASKFMEVLCSEISLRKDISLNYELQALCTRSAYDDLFGSLMHRRINQTGYKMTATPLYNPQLRNVSQILVVKVNYRISFKKTST